MKSLLIALFSLLPALAQAQLDCIVPTREEGFDPKKPGAAQLQRAARAAVAIVQKNAVFMQGNKPVRVRSSISYAGWDHQSATVITKAYNQKAWLAGGCKISEFSDRGGGLSDGTIAIYINEPSAIVGGQLGGGELMASGIPTLLTTIASFPVYARGDNQDDPVMLLSRAGYKPWVTVTVAELLDWRERELRKKEDEHEATLRQSGNELNEAKIEEIYRNMKQVNPVEAEKLRNKMLASLEKMRADNVRHSTQASQWITQQRSAFDAYRASLTPAQLATPGTISNSMTRDKVVRVDDPAGKQLARLDPAYARRDPKHIHVIVVSLSEGPRADPNYEWNRASKAALDYAALANLLTSE